MTPPPRLIAGLLAALLSSGCPGDDTTPVGPSDVAVDAGAGDTGIADAADAAPDPGRVVPKLPLDDTLRLNQLQVLGTHNSYHVLDGPADLSEYEYWQDPLDVQLGDQGVRQFEIDVHWHDDPGRFEVYHVPMVDEGTSCRALSDCLALIRDWSYANPGHAPVFVMVEPKDDMAQIAAAAGALDAIDEALIAGHYDDLDATIRDALPPEQRLEPDAVRGDHPTLATALAADGWPTLAAARGRVVFIMLDTGSHHEAYTYGRTTLAGRAMFVLASTDAPYAGFLKIDGPVGSEGEAITAAVEAGFIVRTRADSCCAEARANDPSRLAAALASGAQMVSTDWVVPHPDTGYSAAIPGGTVARCNPVTAPPECLPEHIESLGAPR